MAAARFVLVVELVVVLEHRLKTPREARLKSG